MKSFLAYVYICFLSRFAKQFLFHIFNDCFRFFVKLFTLLYCKKHIAQEPEPVDHEDRSLTLISQLNFHRVPPNTVSLELKLRSHKQAYL